MINHNRYLQKTGQGWLLVGLRLGWLRFKLGRSWFRKVNNHAIVSTATQMNVDISYIHVNQTKIVLIKRYMHFSNENLLQNVTVKYEHILHLRIFSKERLI